MITYNKIFFVVTNANRNTDKRIFWKWNNQL